MSQVARDFIEKIGNEYPEKRLSINEALAHPFIKRHIEGERLTPVLQDHQIQ